MRVPHFYVIPCFLSPYPIGESPLYSRTSVSSQEPRVLFIIIYPCLPSSAFLFHFFSAHNFFQLNPALSSQFHIKLLIDMPTMQEDSDTTEFLTFSTDTLSLYEAIPSLSTTFRQSLPNIGKDDLTVLAGQLGDLKSCQTGLLGRLHSTLLPGTDTAKWHRAAREFLVDIDDGITIRLSVIHEAGLTNMSALGAQEARWARFDDSLQRMHDRAWSFSYYTSQTIKYALS